MYTISEINDKNTWDRFTKAQQHANILQSWEWGDFQESLKRKVWRLGIFDNTTLVGVAMAQFVPTRLRSHIYISNGPVITPGHEVGGLRALVLYLREEAVSLNAKFIRMDPLWEKKETNDNHFIKASLIKAGTHVQAENKWILDITPDNETLLAGMKKETRYEVNRSIRDSVVVKSSQDTKDYPIFKRLFDETAKRQNFIAHPDHYYKKQFEIFAQSQIYKLYWVEVDSKPIASALIAFYGDTAFYLHAASVNDKEYNKVFAPQAIIWKAIQDGKSSGVKYFDFWGVAETDDPKDEWAGFTRFKKGFGGYLFKTIRAHDFPLSPIYFGIKLLESTRNYWGLMYYKLIVKK